MRGIVAHETYSRSVVIRCGHFNSSDHDHHSTATASTPCTCSRFLLHSQLYWQTTDIYDWISTFERR